MEELVERVNKTLEIFNLDVISIEPVSDSFSSTVRIIKLKNGEKDTI